LIAAKDIGTGVGGIPDEGQNAGVAQPTPYELTGPRAAVGALGKAQTVLREALNNGVGTAGLLKQAKNPLHGAAYFVVGIDDDAAPVVMAKAYRQGKSQLTLVCLVQLAAQEAPAQEMQLCLGHRALQAE